MRYFLYIFLTIRLFANDDLELVKLAYNNGLKPVPSSFENLLTVLNTTSKELSKDKIILGKKLFFEKELSLDRDISCASCHSFDKGGADGKLTAIGHKNQKNPFHLNTPTVLNSVFSKKFFWNGRSETLKNQAKGPLQAPFEMAITKELAEQRIKEKEEYKEMFQKVYGQNISFENIVDAIAAYEKTIITRGRFDDFLAGEFDAMNKPEKEGLKLFITKGCVGCHNGIGLGGEVLRRFPLSYHRIWSMAKPLEVQELQKRYKDFLSRLDELSFKDNNSKLNYMKFALGDENTKLLKEGFFHQIEESETLQVMITSSCTKCHEKNTNHIQQDLVKKIAFPFDNIGGFLGDDATQYFKVPLLRNIVQTKPYFHNGSVEKLEDAIKIMGRHQSRTDLTDSEIDKIILFLKAVDGEMVEY
ncbi:MAG: hypothetical protein M0P43_03605 [Arcobacteraceae bacterium]|nr:hypothetical protein [Arcobacteraceae bacterium]